MKNINVNSPFNSFVMIITFLIVFSLMLPLSSFGGERQVQDHGKNNNTTSIDNEHPLPKLKDPRLKVELVADHLFVPTGMAFLDKDNILVLKRYRSTYLDPLGGLTTVNLISNGIMRQDPVLTVLSGICDINNHGKQCGNFNERGLLGIALRKINNTNTALERNVEAFLYYTEITLTGEVLGNRVYKYLWDGEHLINPTLILDLPATPGPNHNSGKILIGPDGYLYTIIGDQGKRHGQLQNVKNGPSADNTSVILRVNPDTGLAAPGNPFIQDTSTSKSNKTSISPHNNSQLNEQQINSTDSLSRYFAYGIRNGFGLAFDPITGNLWDTENGAYTYDEINMVEPGFNSGWQEIAGPIGRSNKTEAVLVRFTGSNYSDPEFSWKAALGVTALEFFNSSKLGSKYKNNLFVGDYGTGSLYFFKVNQNRDGIQFENNQNDLRDLVADTNKERIKVVLGTGFDIITDIKTGPDGYLYIVSYSEYSNSRPDNSSRIYRIVPTQ